MRQLQLIPLIVYGVLGYALGVALVIAPFALGFDSESTELAASAVAGVGLLLAVLLGSTPASATKLVPLVVLEAIGYAYGLGLVLLPFLVGLTDDRRATLCYAIAGVAFFLITLAGRFPRASVNPPTATSEAAPDDAE